MRLSRITGAALLFVAGASVALSIAVRTDADSRDDGADRGQAQLDRSPGGEDALPPYAPPVARPAIPVPLKKERVDGRLDELYRVDLVARTLGGGLSAQDASRLPESLRASVETGALALDDAGRVQVFVDTAADPAALAPALEQLGMEIQRVEADHRIVQGMLPVSAIDAASTLPGVLMIRPPERAFLNAGSTLTQGDAILDADDLRATFGVDGSGVRVGFISDGVEGLATAQASGDLPQNVNTTTCDVIETAPVGQPANPTSPGAGAEGTALMEIVHDIAPGAELWMGYFGLYVSTATQFDFTDAVTCLAQNVDVIVDDVGFFNVGLYDGTSVISTNASTQYNSNLNPLRGYYVAAGNQASQHYQGDWVDELPPLGNTTDFHLFQPSSTTTDQLVIGARAANPIFVPTGGTVVIFLQWNDPWGFAPNDYDLYLVRNSNASVVGFSENLQIGLAAHLPAERIVFTNTGTSGYFDIYINRFDADVVRTFDMFVARCDCVPLPTGVFGQPLLNFNTASSSIPNNADAHGGVFAIGAISSQDPGFDLIEPYSSQGPANPQPFATAVRKPDVTGIDAVNVSGAGGFPTNFLGTSAAAPHIGGIAALILACRPDLQHGEPLDQAAVDRTILRTALINAAVDLGVPGFDNVFGAGRADADAAALAAGCTPATATPTPTRTPTATPTSTPTATATLTPGDIDTDGDGCSDVKESGDDESLGGLRDPNDPADFFDVDGNSGIDLFDTLDILQRFGLLPGDDGYALLYDRYIPSGAQPWQTAWATGVHIGIDLEDALANLQSFGHSCFSDS